MMRRILACSLAAVAAVLSLTGLAQDRRVFTAGRFALVLNGSDVGLLRSAEGGEAQADVILENGPGGQKPAPKKHLGSLSFIPVQVQAGFDLAPLFYSDLADFVSGHQQRRSGAIVVADFDFHEKARREFSQALISEVAFPSFDSSAKDPAYMTVTWAPENTRLVKSSGKLQSPVSKKPKIWIPSNFRLEIDGLDCTRVNKIEGLTIKQKIIENAIGEVRDYQKEPGALEIPNLKITLAESSAESWMDWYEDFVIKGNCTDDKEKGGRLVFLAPNLQTELLEIKFFNLGIFKLTTDKAEANADAIKRMTAELYCEKMELVPKGKLDD